MSAILSYPALELPALTQRFRDVRAFSRELCQPLEASDFEPQAMADCSPTKWHLAHTTWFFEAFVLGSFQPGYTPHHPTFGFLFNSYYNAVGERQPRPERGLLTRPLLKEVLAYRQQVEDAVETFLATQPEPAAQALIELGCHHEQQHQELMLTDIKYLFSKNPLVPAYHRPPTEACAVSEPLPAIAADPFLRFEGGVVQVGRDASDSVFAYDNEGPRHRVFLEPFAVAKHLVTNAEYAEFVGAGGYQRPEFWLSEGWQVVSQRNWQHPLYWRGTLGERQEFTLAGLQALVPEEPVSHLSLYEADAFARFSGARLPREHEWEFAVCSTESRQLAAGPNFAEARRFHPARAGAAGSSSLTGHYGDVWEWTSSAYAAYPGYQAPAGAVGEYNGKFMCNQFVLRGGSCATSQSHMRSTYRNFFYAPDRWQFSGLRLAKDI